MRKSSRVHFGGNKPKSGGMSNADRSISKIKVSDWHRHSINNCGWSNGF